LDVGADERGAGILSASGKAIPMPNIDSIARNGVRFSDGYVSCPYCTTKRAAL
jgi:arylsulfatase A-like enzyme